MSNALQPKPRIIGHKTRICIVASKYNEKFTDALVENTIEELGTLIPLARIDLIRVPGAFEIPAAVAILIDRKEFNCVIALGLIIRGDTHHADLIGASVTNALQTIAIENKIPVIHEVLLVENEKQAYARCIASSKNRGREAARAAASIVDVFSNIEKSMPKIEEKKNNLHHAKP
jgi:6,7-dimethyl-8-ribityllumazine synthase